MISERAFSRAFPSFWRELFPLLTPRFISLFNEAYEKELQSKDREKLLPLDVLPGPKRLDIIAEFAFRLAELANENNFDLSDVSQHKSTIVEAEKKAFRLVEKYEGSQPVATPTLSMDELNQGLQLSIRYKALYSIFSKEYPIEFCPRFNGAGFLNSCEGDISIGNTLIEVKTTTRRLSSNDLKQLIVYIALDANAGTKRWTHIGLFNPRRGTFHRAEIDPLILRLSGGKPRSDVLAELAAFAESNETTKDHQF